ncbi:hypothetical protein EBT31_05390 [bacterium]|nr:hypothetical protein [bacterium]NBX51066.1 hypothetical protein [bacterium]
MNSAASFLDAFVQDEVKCRCLDEETFGAPLDNTESDVPLYDQYNRGLVLGEQGLERTNLALEGGEKRPGLTGYIPSAEEGFEMGANPKPKALILDLGEPGEDELMLSAKRRGIVR